MWSQLGADATTLTATPAFTSTHGLTGSVTLMGPNSLVAVVCPETLCSWNVAGTTGFAVGDSLIWTADTGNSGNGPLVVNFTSNNVLAAGALIQADGPAQFTANIEAFDGVASLGTFAETSDISGDAIFIGALDSTAANITSVEFSITSCEGDCTDFAIDTVSMRVPGGGTPTATATGGTPTPTATATAHRDADDYANSDADAGSGAAENQTDARKFRQSEGGSRQDLHLYAEQFGQERSTDYVREPGFIYDDSDQSAGVRLPRGRDHLPAESVPKEEVQAQSGIYTANTRRQVLDADNL